MNGFSRSATFGAAGVMAGLALAAGGQSARASTISGFSSFQLNAPGCCNGAPATHGTTLNATGSYGGAAFYNQTVNVSSGFTASFTFTAPVYNDRNDGIVFVVQSDARGDTADGNYNAGMNYSTGGAGNGFITNATGLVIDYNTNGIGVEDESATSPFAAATVGPSTGGDTNAFALGGDTVNVSITYSPGSYKVSLSDASSNSSSYTFSDSLSNVDQPLAYVGFSIGSGGTTNTISNFTFTTTPEPATATVMMASSIGLLARRRRLV